MNKKGLMLLSGGLDSTLAARVLIEQGIELVAINFLTCFCNCTKKGCKNEARKVSEELGLELKLLNVTKEYLEIIKNPAHGYGSNMNPCIDCRIFMFKKAKEYMAEIGASFIVTGETLGQRPMSQRLDAMNLIERESGLKGLVLRPLSAKLLEPSKPELEGVVDREKLLNIQGRSRKPQIALAAEYNITDYPCPAGGCLLTDPGFADRMRDLMAHDAFSLENILLLKIGRHFRIGPMAKFVVGRNQEENERLLGAAKDGDILFDIKEIPGPLGLIRGNGVTNDIIKHCGDIVARYSDLESGEIEAVYWRHPSRDETALMVAKAREEAIIGIRI